MTKEEIIAELSNIIKDLMLENMTDQPYFSRKEIKKEIEALIDKID